MCGSVTPWWISAVDNLYTWRILTSFAHPSLSSLRCFVLLVAAEPSLSLLALLLFVREFYDLYWNQQARNTVESLNAHQFAVRATSLCVGSAVLLVSCSLLSGLLSFGRPIPASSTHFTKQNRFSVEICSMIPCSPDPGTRVTEKNLGTSFHTNLNSKLHDSCLCFFDSFSTIHSCLFAFTAYSYCWTSHMCSSRREQQVECTLDHSFRVARPNSTIDCCWILVSKKSVPQAMYCGEAQKLPSYVDDTPASTEPTLFAKTGP